VTDLIFESNLVELYSEALKKHIKVISLDSIHGAASEKKVMEVLDETLLDIRRATELEYESTPMALDRNTWLLMGALNLAHRVVCLERDAALQTRDMEVTLAKLLDDVPDDAIPSDSTADFIG
jgi:hypothetical protein